MVVEAPPRGLAQFALDACHVTNLFPSPAPRMFAALSVSARVHARNAGIGPPVGVHASCQQFGRSGAGLRPQRLPMDAELSSACNLLQAEFPDLPRSTLEAALRAVDLDIPAARRKLLDVQSSTQGAGEGFRGRSVSHNPLPPPTVGGCCPEGGAATALPAGHCPLPTLLHHYMQALQSDASSVDDSSWFSSANWSQVRREHEGCNHGLTTSASNPVLNAATGGVRERRASASPAPTRRA